MFLVRDSAQQREEKIEQMLKEDPAIGVLIASAHFEWVLRRAIINLSDRPNREIRAKMETERWHGLDGYKRAWKDLVKPKTNMTLPQIIDNWSVLGGALMLRHKLIHGVESCSKPYATEKARCILAAANCVIEFSKNQGFDVMKRLKVRKK